MIQMKLKRPAKIMQKNWFDQNKLENPASGLQKVQYSFLNQAQLKMPPEKGRQQGLKDLQ